MSIDAMKLIPAETFDETAFEQKLTSKYNLPENPGISETMKTILKLINPVRVNGAGNYEIKTLFRDTYFKNHHTLGALTSLTDAGLSDATGTLTDQGIEVFKAIAAKYKGVEGELAY